MNTSVAALRDVPAPRSPRPSRAVPRPGRSGSRPDGADLVPVPVLGRAVRGDADAVRTVVAAVQVLARRLCRARLGPGDDGRFCVDDISQEICLAAARALPGFDVDGGFAFRALVIGIARHKIADAVRSAARNRSEVVAELPDRVDDGARPEDVALAGETARRVSAMLARLEPRQAEILVLRIVGGLSADEVAHIVGTSPGAVRVAQHRALTTLRRLVDPQRPTGVSPGRGAGSPGCRAG